MVGYLASAPSIAAWLALFATLMSSSFFSKSTGISSEIEILSFDEDLSYTASSAVGIGLSLFSLLISSAAIAMFSEYCFISSELMFETSTYFAGT